ncbi:winged helix-turn-helix domain-containing protein [Sphingomonas sp. 10B4]|uniref:winged helix-turn-helix domain-containing protein n=1 Tax=Sphingomonas sp. 10B4 TaxID=3048575 RepID=UPI002AB34569|nr:winged helix-turn-helix domain-containing protein [Sphingomonas sp. 10B4]MDY7525846.1 winged helix-turn-helix domain-containing protein [Sphingomonas sp. 10B4]MEB0281661.1 winged helix-turn-helix domain-containing protein [Sphingomonas sp. 10B4]
MTDKQNPTTNGSRALWISFAGASAESFNGFERDPQSYVDRWNAALCGGDSPYNDRPGSKGQAETSGEAAEAIASEARVIRQKVMRALYQCPAGLTAEEIAERIGHSRPATQPRTSELRSAGRIFDSGHRRRNASGKRAIVWSVLEPKA